jgi:ketosteroid isomerase-like protein
MTDAEWGHAALGFVAGGNQPSTRDVTLALCAAREANDRDEVARLLGKDVEWHAPHSVRSRALRGRDLVAKALTGAATGKLLDVSSIERQVTQVVVEGDTAVVRQLMTAQLLAGGTYRNDYCWIYTISDGLVQRIDEYADTLVIARAGFVPLQGTEDKKEEGR